MSREQQRRLNGRCPCGATGRRSGLWLGIHHGELTLDIPIIGREPRAIVLGPVDARWPWLWMHLTVLCGRCGHAFTSCEDAPMRVGPREGRTERVTAELRRRGWRVTARLHERIIPVFQVTPAGYGRS